MKIFPKSPALKRIRLIFCNDSVFPAKLKEYLQQELPRGVPSFFSTLKSFPPERLAAMETVVRELLAAYRNDGWTLHFAAQLFDYLRPGCDVSHVTIALNTHRPVPNACVWKLQGETFR
jgi:hypothetical protein